MDPNFAGTNQTAGDSTSLLWLLLLVVAIIVVVAFWKWWCRRRFYSELEQSNALAFLKIIMPRQQKGEEDEKKDYRELLAVAEPFLSSLASNSQNEVTKYSANISLEIIAKDKQIFFYLGAPEEQLVSIERQIHSEYPAAHIEQATEREYDIFPHPPSIDPERENFAVDACLLGFRRQTIFPIRTYKNLELDPLNAITNSLSKLDEASHAAIQILIKPISQSSWEKQTSQAMKDIQNGYLPGSTPNRFWKLLRKSLSKQGSPVEDEKAEQRRQRLTPLQENQLKQIGEKASRTAFLTQIRVVSVAPTASAAKINLNNILTSFAQFNAPESNGFTIGHFRDVPRIVTDYLLRRMSGRPVLVLNTEELASIYHFPNRNVDTPNIFWLAARKMPPPTNLPQEGTIIGESIYRNETKQVRLLPKDRSRHLYMIGKTGVGKTVMFENLILQDIAQGHGVAYIDPNGDAIEFLLQRIPKERAEDVILFNPADSERPIGLNLLDWHRPEDRDFLVQEAVAMFYKLFDPSQTGIVGPQFEHWMRNAALTLMAEPQGGTLIEIPRLFTDKDFENEMVARVQDPVVRSFWTQQLAKTSDYHKSEMLNYFVSKFGRFMTNDMMRNIIGQKASAFDFRQIMDEKKILLVNLSKGLIGDINAQLLGMILVTKLQVAAFSRQNIAEEKRQPFYLYVDEFQNVTTDSFATILSEARKYGLVLNITNQYIAQLPEMIRDAVMGNAGNLISWRIGAMDAEFIVKEFDPLTVDDLVNIDKFNFYIKMLIDNTPTRPFNVQGLPPKKGGDPKLAEGLRQLSRLKYGRDRAEVDAEIKKRSRLDEIPMPAMNESAPSVMK